jgi:predicted lipoprotein
MRPAVVLLTLIASAALTCAACTQAAFADVTETVNAHILPSYAAFATATQSLADTAAADCSADALRPAFNAAYDAWLGVEHLRFGPVMEDGQNLAILFWPDPKGSGAKAQRALLLGDAAQLQTTTFAQQSVAARGLAGLERLLYPKTDLPADPCALIRATATDLAATAQRVDQAWIASYAQTVLTAGQQGNTTYLHPSEARQAMFTAIISGLAFDLDARLARPLGSFDAPHPERAEAVASGRSLTNLRLSLRALRTMVTTLTPDAALTLAAFDRALHQADLLDDPVLAGVADPQGRLKVEILHQRIAALRDIAVTELGTALKVGKGFNAADGD